MADNKVTLEINVDAKDAEKAIEQFGASAVKSVKQTESSLDNLSSSSKKAFGGITAGFATLVAGVFAFSKAINEAMESESAVRSLGLAIAGTGEYTAEALKSLTDYSQALSDITGIDDDVINGQLALAKSFGITNDQAKNLVTAATNLAAITGVNLETAVRQLGGTFDGTLGRIANLGPEFRNLTQEQIENGAAIDLINSKYKEAGATLGSTFEGSLNKLKNQFNDAFKAVGLEIIGDPSIKRSLEQIGQTLVSLGPAISFFTKIFLEGFKAIARGASFLSGLFAGAFGKFSKDFLGLDEIAASLEKFSNGAFEMAIGLTDLSNGANDANTASKDLDKTLKDVSDNASKAGKGLSESYKKASEEAQKFIKEVTDKSGSELEVAGKKAGELFAKIDGLERKGLVTFQQAVDARTAVLSEFNEKAEKQTKERLKEEEEALKKSEEVIRSIGENPIRIFFDDSSVGNFEDKLAASIAGAVNQSLNGREGAVKGLSAFVSAVASKFGPIGAIFGSIIEKFTQGPEATKAFVKDFLESIPQIIQNVIESAPQVLLTIWEVLLSPNFWATFVKSFINGWLNAIKSVGGSAGRAIGYEFLKSVETFFRGFLQNVANVFSTIGTNVANALANVFQGIIQAFKDVFGFLFDPLINALKPLTDALTNLADKVKGIAGQSGGSGLAAEAAQNVGEVFTGKKKLYANGGIVPNIGLGLGDTVPMFMPGELIVPTDLVGQLASFLANQESGASNGQSNAILMGILQAVQQPITVNAQAKVNQSAFADIILQLNRQNARLSA